MNENKEKKQKRAYVKKTLSQKMAVRAARIVGSWWFIAVQTVIIAGWIVINTIGFIKGWDLYPFVFLNLMLSISAAYAAPVILMSQNRDAERDRIRAINDLTTDRRVEREVKAMRKVINRIDRKLNK